MRKLPGVPNLMGAPNECKYAKIRKNMQIYYLNKIYSNDSKSSVISYKKKFLLIMRKILIQVIIILKQKTNTRIFWICSIFHFLTELTIFGFRVPVLNFITLIRIRYVLNSNRNALLLNTKNRNFFYVQQILNAYVRMKYRDF